MNQNPVRDFPPDDKSSTHPLAEILYYQIAKDALTSATKTSDAFEKKQSITTAMVFSVLALEAFINQEYTAFEETKKILENDEKLKLETKWLMLPLLLGNTKTFEAGIDPFNIFHELVRTRNNRLVHFKPYKETMIEGKEFKGTYFGDFVGNLELANKFLDCVIKMIDELHELTGRKTRKSNFINNRYLSEIRAVAVLPVEILNKSGSSD